MTSAPFTLAHLSDTHVGYEAYKAVSASGDNQRSLDIVKAFRTCVDEIIAADPPLVIHSGDVADRTVIPFRMVVEIQNQFRRLAGTRADGTRRQLVIVAGNHELPRNRKEACFLELVRGLPGVHVATLGYSRLEFPDAGQEGGAAPELADVLVHALPHDALKEIDFADVHPVPGKVNIFSAHGVAGGSELYVRSLGREFAIPTDVLLREWEYGALGHWHKQGPIPLVGTGARDGDPDRGRIWYAGSPENMGFGDLRDNGTERGWLEVQINPGSEPTVKRRHIPIRSMMRLPHLDAAGMSPDEVVEALLERISAAGIAGAVVGQIVEGVTRETWSLVDVPRVKESASSALHYELTVRHRSTNGNQDDSQTETQGGLGEIDTILDERAKEVLDAHERDGGLALAKRLVAIEVERSLRGDAGRVAAAAADETSHAPHEAQGATAQESESTAGASSPDGEAAA